MSMTASLTITINQPVQRASAARGLDAAARLLRDLESDANALGLSAKDAAALAVATDLVAAALAAIDPHSSHHRPGAHLISAIKAADGVTY
jgi:hypothetical protein